MIAWEREGQILGETRWAEQCGVHSPPRQDQAGRGQSRRQGGGPVVGGLVALSPAEAPLGAKMLVHRFCYSSNKHSLNPSSVPDPGPGTQR